MSRPAYCHIKTDIDGYISEYVRNKSDKYSSWNIDVVAAKIQFYNQAHPDEPLKLEIENVSEAAEKLISYEEQQRKLRYDGAHADKTDVYQSTAKALKYLKRRLDQQDRTDAVDFLTYYFSRKLDIICNRYGVTREMAANGFSQNGKTRFGEFAIFESIYEDIQVRLNNLYCIANPTEANDNMIRDLELILNNWNGLVVYAKVKLSLTEKLQLGNFFNYAKALKVIDDVELDMEENSEELVKDPVDRIKDDQIPSFKRVSQVTRTLLSRVPVLEKYQDDSGEWHYKLDELGQPIVKTNKYGIPQTMNSTAAHRMLGDILRNVKSKHDVYRKLAKASQDILELRPLVDVLTIPESYYNENGHLYYTEEQLAQARLADRYLNCLFLDYNKVFQAYAKTIQVVQNIGGKKLRLLKTLVVNEQPNHIKQVYEQKLLNYQGTSLSLFNAAGGLREDQMTSFIKDLEFFRDKETGKFHIKQGQRSLAISKLNNIALRLNIPYVSRTVIGQIISKPTNLSDLMKKLENVYNNTITYYNNHKNISYGQIGSIRNEFGLIPYTNVYEYGVDEKKDFSTSYMQRLANAFTKYMNIYDVEHSTSLESKVRTKNAKGDTITIFSLINPGFLSQFVKDIQGFAENHDLTGLRQYLDAKFSHNTALCNIEQANQEAKDAAEGKRSLGTTKFRIKWLNDLYNSKIDEVWSFIQQLSVIRNLGNGTTNKPFEDMSRKEHLSMILSDFVQMKRNSNRAANLAYYPVFISGDANQHKTITAPIYNDATIIEGLVDLFYQERNLQDQLKAMKEDMQSNGYIPIEAKDDGFYLMPAFNTIFANKDVSRLSKQEVRELIKNYFDKEGKAYKDFKDTCIKYSIVTDLGNDKFRISSIVADIAGKENLDSFLHNFWLNEKFAMSQQMAIMTISPAYYKNLKDLQKRYKETHSSGQKLDLDAMWNDEKVFGDNPIQTTIYLSEVKLNGEDIDSDFMEVLKKKNPSVYDSYKKISATDGQAYRTIESYRKIAVASNQWSDEAEALYRDILSIREKHRRSDGTIDFDAITDEEINKIAQSSVIFQPIKPFLFTHEKYGFKKDGSEEGNIPVQIKCSEAVLIPELMPKDTKMRHVAEYMTENNIDVAVMDSAIKVGAWGQTDISKATNREELFDIMSKGKVHNLSYADYIIQVNVPAHEYQQRLFATQIRKLILGGEYDSEIDYFNGKIPTLYRGNGEKYIPKSMNKYELKHFYNELLVSNFIDSLKEFLGDVQDKDKIANLLIRSILNNDRNSVDTAIGMIIDEKTKDFTIPLCEGIQEHDIVNNLIAVFKQAVNKQTILGGSGVQVASYGIKGYDESKNLHFVTNEDKTNILYAEVEIPLIHKYKDKNGKEKEVDYEKYCNNDCTLKTNEKGEILIDLDFPGIRDFVAYRIPTERDYSMINCKAVRFTRPTAGITIKVPSQGTTIAGFDFDIDKLYFMFKDFQQDKEGKWINYEFEKPTYENPKFTRDNMLLEIIRQRLMDPHTLKERTTPGGFPNASETAKDLMQLMYNQEAYKGRHDLTLEDIRQVRKDTGDKDFEPEYDYTDLETLLILNERNQLAAKLIGIFANQNTNHVYCAGLSQLTLNTPIAFGQYAETGLDDLINAPEGVDTYRTLAELLAASVDAVKDPVLGYMNLNTLTANAACLLGRLGYDFFDIGLLLNQPVIKYVCNYAQENDLPLDYAINNFTASIKDKDISNIEASSPTRSELIYNIVNKNENNVQEDEQIAILRLFENIVKCANELNTIVTKTKFTAANAVKPNFGNYYSSKADLEKLDNFEYIQVRTTGLQEAPIVDTYDIDLNNIPSYLGQLATNPMAFEQGMYDCMKKAMEKLLEYFPYETDLYKTTRNIFKQYARYGALDEKTINLIHRDLPVFILSSFDESDFSYAQCQVILNELPQRLLDLLKEFPELNELPIFQNLEIRKNKKTDKLEISMDFSTSIDEKTDKEAIIESWESLLKHQDDRVANIAKALFIYNFAKTGFGYGPSSFIHYAPTLLKTGYKQHKLIVHRTDNSVTTYLDFWNSLVGNTTSFAQLSDEQLLEFLRQFIANHLENKAFTTSITDATREFIEPLFTINGNFKSSDYFIEITADMFIEKDSTDLLTNIANPVYVQDVKEPVGYIFKPCLRFYDSKSQEYVYYMLTRDSMFLMNNDKSNLPSRAIYQRVYPIGETNKSLHYASDLYQITPLSETEEEFGIEDPEDGTIDNPAPKEDGITPEDSTKGVGEPKGTKDTALNQLLDDLAHLMVRFKTKGQFFEDSQLSEMEKSVRESMGQQINLDNFVEVLSGILEDMGSERTAKEEQMIKDILAKAAKEDLIVLDENGNLMKSCK